MGARSAMRGGSEALDVALGLLRAPALRGRLRARPLPAGVGELLAVASGSAESARQAAERSGHDAAELVEAARFFVQQVLLAEDADAYRVLGADRHADQATLRDHHRLLLRWLHPDRTDGPQWESALSARVNQAWNLVRSPSARERYDQALPPVAPGATPGPDAGARPPAYPPPADPAPSPATAAPAAGRLAAIVAADEAGAPRWGAPVAVGVLGLLCLWLAWLAITRDDDAGRRAVAQSRPADAAVEIPPPAPLPEPLARAVSAIATPPSAPAETPAAAVAADPGAVIEWASPAEPGVLPGPQEPATTRPRAAFAGVDPAAPSVAAARAMDAPFVASPPQATAGLPGEAGVPQVPAPGVAHAAGPVEAPVAADALATLDASVHTTRAKGSTPAPALALAPTPAPSLAPTALAATAPAPAPAADPLALYREAENTVAALAGFLVGAGAGPDWTDAPTRLDADSLRGTLLARHADVAAPRMHMEVPHWVLGQDTASMSGAYRVEDRRRTVETGVVRVELARRGTGWRVAGVRLEPAR